MVVGRGCHPCVVCCVSGLLAVHPIQVLARDDTHFERGMVAAKVHGACDA